MTAATRMCTWSAPRGYWTHRGAERWANEHNPHQPGSATFYTWRRDFWNDQASRSGRRAILWLIVAVAAQIANLIIQATGWLR